MLAPASPLVPYTLSAPLLPDRSGIPRTIDVEFGLLLQMFLLIVELVTTVLLELNYATCTVLGLVKIGNDGDSAIAVVVLVLLDLVAGDDDDQAAVELEVLGKE